MVSSANKYVLKTKEVIGKPFTNEMKKPGLKMEPQETTHANRR